MRASAASRRPAQLDDGRILIRELDLEDVDEYYAAARASLPELAPWLGWAHDGLTRDEVEDWAIAVIHARANNQGTVFVVREQATGEFLGSCSLNQIDPVFLRGNCGYWVVTGKRGQGYAPAAVRLVARYGFERMKLQRVEIVAMVDNHASQRVAEKAGATREGLMRNRIRLRGKPEDAIGFSLIPADVS